MISKISRNSHEQYLNNCKMEIINGFQMKMTWISVWEKKKRILLPGLIVQVILPFQQNNQRFYGLQVIKF